MSVLSEEIKNGVIYETKDSNVRLLSEQEIDDINRHIRESGNEAVVNSTCQLLGLHDTDKLYHSVVQLYGQPPHLVHESQPSRGNPEVKSHHHHQKQTKPEITVKADVKGSNGGNTMDESQPQKDAIKHPTSDILLPSLVTATKYMENRLSDKPKHQEQVTQRVPVEDQVRNGSKFTDKIPVLCADSNRGESEVKDQVPVLYGNGNRDEAVLPNKVPFICSDGNQDRADIANKLLVIDGNPTSSEVSDRVQVYSDNVVTRSTFDENSWNDAVSEKASEAGSFDSSGMVSMASSLNDRLRTVSSKVKSPSQNTNTDSQHKDYPEDNVRTARLLDSNNNSQEAGNFKPGMTVLSESNSGASTTEFPECGDKRKCCLEQNEMNFLPEESKYLYPLGTPAKITKRRQAVHLPQSPYLDDPSLCQSIHDSRERDIPNNSNSPQLTPELKLKKSKSKVKQFSGNPWHTGRTICSHLPPRKCPAIVIQTSVEDVKQVKVATKVDGNPMTYEVGKIIVNKVSLNFVTLETVRYVRKREVYTRLLPQSTGLYGECNFKNVCKTLGIECRVITKEGLPHEVFPSDGLCKRFSQMLMTEDQLVTLYSRYLEYAERKKNKFRPTQRPHTTAAANTTSDVIDLLKIQDVRIVTQKIEANVGEGSPQKIDNLNTATKNDESLSSIVEHTNFSIFNLSPQNKNYTTLQSKYDNNVSSVTCSTFENTSSMSLHTLPSSDCTASAFIKSNYEVLAQDPYAGPLVSGVDLMNSTVEELGIRKKYSQWGVTNAGQSSCSAERNSQSFGIATEENNSLTSMPVLRQPSPTPGRVIGESMPKLVKILASSKPGSFTEIPESQNLKSKPETETNTIVKLQESGGMRDFASQTMVSQIPLNINVESCLSQYQKEITDLKKDLKEARQQRDQWIDKYDSTEAILNFFFKSQNMLQQNIKKFVCLNGKIADTLVSLTEQIEQEKEATRVFSENVQAIENK